jgi:mannose-6-phosphate isomerase-like protein (cupin superfamily)
MKIVHAAPTDHVSEQISVKRLTDELGATKLHANVWMVAEGSMMKHLHREQEELYIVLDGTAVVSIDGAEHKLGERDTISVPAGAEHQVTNAGWGPMTFIAVAAPAVEGDAEFR